MHFNDSRVASKGKKIESEVDEKSNASINYYERGNGYCESAKIRKNGFICPRPSLLDSKLGHSRMQRLLLSTRYRFFIDATSSKGTVSRFAYFRTSRRRGFIFEPFNHACPPRRREETKLLQSHFETRPSTSGHGTRRLHGDTCKNVM